MRVLPPPPPRTTCALCPLPILPAVEPACALRAALAPVGEEPVHHVAVLQHDGVHMAPRLPVQRHSRGLTLGADPLRVIT